MSELYEIKLSELEQGILKFDDGVIAFAPKLLASEIAERMFNKRTGDKISTDEISFEIIFKLNELIEEMESYVEEILDSNGVDVIDEQ